MNEFTTADLADMRRQSVLESLTILDAVTRDPRAWSINGERGTARNPLWPCLYWANARIDIGPSPAGNMGPYAHVPLIARKVPDEYDPGVVCRVYPRTADAVRWCFFVNERGRA